MKRYFQTILAFIVIISSCAIKDEKEDLRPTAEYKIELLNMEDFEIDGQIVTIGSEKSYYFEKEKPSIQIRNLPLNGYKVKIDGIEWLRSKRNSNYTYLPNGHLGHRRNTVQIFDSTGNESLRHKVKYHIGRIKPFLNGEHGRFLFRGISSKFEISNIAMGCPNIVISSDQAKITINPDGTYEIKPNIEEHTVTILLQTGMESFEHEFNVIDPPPPKFQFTELNNFKCIDLISSPLFSNVEYNIIEISAVETETDSSLTFKNTNCIQSDKNLRFQKAVYRINDSHLTYSLWME